MTEYKKSKDTLELLEEIKQKNDKFIVYNQNQSKLFLIAILLIWTNVLMFFCMPLFDQAKVVNDTIIIAILITSMFLTLIMVTQRKQHENNMIILNNNNMAFYRITLSMNDADTEKLPAIRKALLKDLFQNNTKLSEEKMWDMFKEHPMYELGEKLLERVNIDISKKT